MPSPGIAAKSTPKPAVTEPQTRVWDIFVRVFHWSLVLAVAIAAASGLMLESRILLLHISAGLAAAALVAARIVWGFTGTTHARFADFVPSGAAIRAHLAGGTRHLGHNPLGALMVLALFALVLGLAVSGLLVLGGIDKSGPFAPFVSFGAGSVVLGLHEVLAYGVLALVAMHLAGVVFESERSHENLTRSMLTGAKAKRPGDHESRPRPAHPLLAAAVIVALAAGAWAFNSAQAARPVPGLPVATLDPGYKAACSECHIAYNPSLLPAASWSGIMAGLKDHFGENAGLPAAEVEAITNWLVAHASETADTKPAYRIAARITQPPYSITGSRSWKRLHDDIPDALFASRAVGSRSNCAACHADAETGRFSPFAIDLPKESLK
ncbi:cytochrome b/b6 domain-containing protein [Phaeovulum sp.]|uniref:cytochrome b/b6 domain-containing protein n=1 Tax=Phaeovulum sp. TaxID=2934796 RepID=UPI00272F4514|nr:cytochrome b/b6 domain-containing protein [Phaeovulum sp.]MDP1669741.1 cytochrome b/b6 domain-containing protein [Phaeovulum sp.]MDP2063247.1 cytochrome b/b6 domain-containing protein [Phaeovulum sp.]MDZ4119029.1 cytochrome b/b6 domain-containing protein [Phaeovulum sp.]